MTTDHFNNAQSAAPKSAEEDHLPRWNFENFYPELPCPEFDEDFSRYKGMVRTFADKYRGRIGTLTSVELFDMIEEKHEFDALGGKLSTFAFLKKAQDSQKYEKPANDLLEKMSPLSSMLAFYSTEIIAIEDDQFESLLLEFEVLSEWEPMLRDMRKYRPHEMPLEVKEYAIEMGRYADGSWEDFYDAHHASKRYYLDGGDHSGPGMTQSEILNLIADNDDPAIREKAYKGFVKALSEDRELSARIYSNLLGAKSVDDKFEKFVNPWDARHLQNNVSADTVDALEAATKARYKDIFQRFYGLKARVMGKERLDQWDRNFNSVQAESRYIPYEEAKAIVLKAFHSFSPEMAEIAQKFFDHGWIDAPAVPNKSGGAFAHPGATYLAQPMVMLNYQGTPGDVMTMAHELGHGVHQYLAARKGDRILETPLTTAETASIFAEMQTYKMLFENAETPEEKRALLFDKVNHGVNTMFRQIQFYDFEKRAHMARREGSLDADAIQEIWLESLSESYGDAIAVDEMDGALWSYIPHFHGTPFYVYAYAFGDGLVNALYQAYEQGDIPDFSNKYKSLLERGGTFTLNDLKEEFGLDATDPTFWNKGLDMLAEMLDQLEVLCEPLIEAKQDPQQGLQY